MKVNNWLKFHQILPLSCCYCVDAGCKEIAVNRGYSIDNAY